MSALNRAKREIGHFFRRNGSIILAVVSVVGVPITAYLSAKAVPKSEADKKMAEEEKGEKLSPVETIAVAAPAYAPAAVAGSATVACICFGTMLSRKQQAAMAGAYIAVTKAYGEFKEKTRQLYGEDSEKQICAAILTDQCKKEDRPNAPEGDKLLFWEEIRGDFFERTMEEVLLAEYHLNRNFALGGRVSLNEFYEFLGLEPIQIGDILGWSCDVGFDFYGYQWIDFNHQKVILDDGLECYVIDMPFLPTGDF